MPAVPSTVALQNIADGAAITASPHRQNYTDIQTALNALIAILDGGASGEFLKNLGGGSVDWGAVANVTMGTALPGSPTDGQEFILVDSTTAPTYAWRLRYVGAKSSNKWVFVGGSRHSATVATSESTGSGTYTDLTTSGPAVTIPVAGDYLVTIGANTGGNEGMMSYAIGGTGAVDADGATDYAASSIWREKKKTGLTAVTLTAKYRSVSGTPTFSDRYIAIEPIAIGG